MKKYYFLALLPLVLLAYLWLFSEAFALLSAASNISVVLGVLLIALCVLSIIKLVFYVKGKFNG